MIFLISRHRCNCRADDDELPDLCNDRLRSQVICSDLHLHHDNTDYTMDHYDHRAAETTGNIEQLHEQPDLYVHTELV